MVSPGKSDVANSKPLVERHGTRYVVPLREGGSLPAIVETEDGQLFVTKFRGAGQGARVLVAELLAGILAQHLGLPVPELCIIYLDEGFGRTERDPEIQDILAGSRGVNVGMRFLEGALNYNPAVDGQFVSGDRAADIVWFDAFITNIDRTPRNPNMLIWGRDLQLIDHGSTLYFHYDWENLDEAKILTPFTPVKQHVLLPIAGDLEAADRRLKAAINESILQDILAQIPDELLMDAPEGRTPPFPTAAQNRDAYLNYLTRRLERSDIFVQETIRAQQHVRQEKPRPLSYRR